MTNKQLNDLLSGYMISIWNGYIYDIQIIPWYKHLARPYLEHCLKKDPNGWYRDLIDAKWWIERFAKQQVPFYTPTWYLIRSEIGELHKTGEQINLF